MASSAPVTASFKHLVESVHVDEHSAAKLDKKLRAFPKVAPLIKRRGSKWDVRVIVNLAESYEVFHGHRHPFRFGFVNVSERMIVA